MVVYLKISLEIKEKRRSIARKRLEGDRKELLIWTWTNIQDIQNEETVGLSSRSSEKIRVTKQTTKHLLTLKWCMNLEGKHGARFRGIFEYQKFESYVSLNISHKSVCFEF